LKSASSTYIVAEDDEKRFEKLLQGKSKSAIDMRMGYLRMALTKLGLGYKLSPIASETDLPNRQR